MEEMTEGLHGKNAEGLDWTDGMRERRSSWMMTRQKGRTGRRKDGKGVMGLQRICVYKHGNSFLFPFSVLLFTSPSTYQQAP